MTTDTDTLPLRGLRSIGEEIASRSDATERRIDALWDEIALAVEQGVCNESQFEWVMRQEAAFGDDDCARWVFCQFLARCAAAPARIGATATDTATHECPTCLAGNGWLEDAERGGMFPCPRCNSRQYDLFMDGHYRPGHTCNTCEPQTRRRTRAGASHYDELSTEATATNREAEEAHIENELF